MDNRLKDRVMDWTRENYGIEVTTRRKRVTIKEIRKLVTELVFDTKVHSSVIKGIMLEALSEELKASQAIIDDKIAVVDRTREQLEVMALRKNIIDKLNDWHKMLVREIKLRAPEPEPDDPMSPEEFVDLEDLFKQFQPNSGAESVSESHVDVNNSQVTPSANSMVDVERIVAAVEARQLSNADSTSAGPVPPSAPAAPASTAQEPVPSNSPTAQAPAPSSETDEEGEEACEEGEEAEAVPRKRRMVNIADCIPINQEVRGVKLQKIRAHFEGIAELLYESDEGSDQYKEYVTAIDAPKGFPLVFSVFNPAAIERAGQKPLPYVLNLTKQAALAKARSK
jgi:hypothetical protein